MTQRETRTSLLWPEVSPKRGPRRSLRPGHTLAMIGVLVIVTAAALSAYFVVSLYESQVSSVRNRLEIPTEAVAHTAETAASEADLSLRAIQHRLAESDVPMLSFDGLRPMVRSLGISAIISRIEIYDAAGRPVVNSDVVPPPPVSVANEAFFKEQVEPRDDRLFISDRIADPVDGSPQIVFSRRLTDATGRFLGVAAVFERTAYLQQVFDSLQMPAGTSISVFNKDGHVLVRSPPLAADDPELKIDFSKREAFIRFRDGDAHGRFGRFRTFGGFDRFIAASGGKDATFVITAAWHAEPALAPWRTESLAIVSSALIGLIVAIGLLFLLRAQIARNEGLLAEVSQSEKRQRDLLMALPDAVAMIDRSLTVEFANRAAERLFGYGPGEMSGLAWPSLMPDDDGAARIVSFDQVDGVPRVEENAVKRRDGTELPVEISHCAYQAQDGTKLLTAIRDISVRRAGEQALRRSQEHLARAQRIALIGSFDRDLVNGAIEWSEQFLKIWGFEQMPDGDRTELLIARVHPEDRADFIEGRGAAIEGKPIPPLDFRITRPDGSIRVLHREFGVIFDESGRPVRLFGTVQDITERNKIETELRRSQEDLARAQRVAGIGSFSRELATGEVYWSAEFRRIWGLEGFGGKITAEFLSAMVHPDERELFVSGRDAALRNESGTSLDFRMTRPDGEERILHREYGVLFDQSGKPVRMFGTVQDITERKRAEMELRRSRENLARAQRLAAIGSFERDFVTGKVQVSEELCRIHGLSPDDPQVHEHLRTVVHPDDRARFDAMRDLGNRGVTASPLDFRIIRPDGQERILHRECEIQLDACGKPTRMTATLQDITERKQAELEILRSRENLLRAQRIANMGSFDYDLASRRTEWSEQMWHIIGCDREAHSPSPRLLLSLVHPDDRELFSVIRERARQGLPTEPFEFRIIRPDGAERIIRREYDMQFGEDGRLLRVFGTMQDVTELRLAEARERELERQLLHSQKLEALGTLAGGIAHDLNNTLVPIMALSKLTARRFEPGTPVRNNLQTIFEASERARDLVQRVLAFSRKDESERGEVNLGEVVREALKLLRATVPSSIEIDAAIEDVPPIRADASQLHQVITNLVSNAAGAIGSDMGTVAISLRLAARQKGEGEVCLSVADSGCGIDETTLRRIFEPFFTTKPVGEGTGLGLSIVHGIVTSHGGRVEVKSTPGKGTRFDLYFPIAWKEDGTGLPSPGSTSERPAA
jgi:PAS domain S-box-containing protein